MEHERRAVRIRGVVQGVGFRPSMHQHAESLGVYGFVRNERDGVWIEIEGPPDVLDRFIAGLSHAAPPASRIHEVSVAVIPVRHETAFRIAATPRDATAHAGIPVDLAPCADCLRELTDVRDRRYRYPFINCAACGPRFTILRELPYDRPKTTMAAFAMCESCLREYETPGDRRFHAEPNACPACGPQVRLFASGRIVLEGDAAVRAAAGAIADGRIVALKNAGGFVLAADARSQAAVMRLRERMRRPHEAFAVMARGLPDALRIAELEERSSIDLVSAASRPIVLAPKRSSPLAPAIAPGLSDVGVCLPSTPLQVLLLADGPPLQVMTTDEPIARTEDEAFAQLAGIADLFLVHDRDIHARVDDSVMRSARRGMIPMRRARGFVPEPIAVPLCDTPVLAVGGHERNTVCLAVGGRAILSQHVGGSDSPDAIAFLDEAIEHLTTLTGVAPAVIAHDLHPDYASTRWAIARGLPRVGIQHHHAHVAACLAEHHRADRVIGIAFDGTGLGDDGSLWGGEILAADLQTSRRLGHLRSIAMPGGEAAIRKPWRIAAAALVDANESLDGLSITTSERDGITALLATDLPPRATGAGRWFDAVAAILGVASEISYDGQAAAQLEALAGTIAAPPFPYAICDVESTGLFEIDLRPAIRELVHERRRGCGTAPLAASFHATLAHAIRETCVRLAADTVVLTGGCFQNRRLLDESSALLEAARIEVLVHRRVPPNNGGIALGQAAITARRLAARGVPCV